MTLQRSNRVTRAAIIVVAIVVCLLVFWGISRLFADSDRSSAPSDAFHAVPAIPTDLTVALDWMPDVGDTGRAMEQPIRGQIRATYLRAWSQWNRSLLAGEAIDLEASFSGPALQGVQDTLLDASSNHTIEQADTSHTLELHLYSADGTIVSFTDHDISLAQVISDQSGNTISISESRVTYDVVMMLRDGVWTVENWVRTNAVPLDAVPSAQTVAGIVSRSGTQILLDGRPYEIAGINYYPRDTPWDRFWPEYDAVVIDQDFARISTLGLNTIRIFVPYSQFGGAQPDGAMLDKLENLLSIANGHGLKVIVTLFDFRVDYRLLDWAAADRHLAGLIPRFKDNPAILAWDLKNEPDRDYGQGRARVDAWLQHTARVVRRFDPSHLITIGWSTPRAAEALPRVSDFISFHFYAPPSELDDAYASIRAAAPDRPIVLTEFGLPTWNSFFFPYGHSEPEQTAYYADVLSTLRQTDASGYLAWTLYDFPWVPEGVAGTYPWEEGAQKRLGVIRLDGSEKPAAALLKPDASLDVPRVSPVARFLKPFWLMFATVLLVGAVTAIVLVRRFNRPIPALGESESGVEHT